MSITAKQHDEYEARLKKRGEKREDRFRTERSHLASSDPLERRVEEATKAKRKAGRKT